MAIRLKVEYSALDITISKQEFASLSQSTEPSALLQYLNLKTDLDYLNLNMSLFLDSDTKNLYFSSQYGSDQVQVVSLSEEAIKSFDPSKTDSLSMGDDDLVFAIGLGKDEEIFITEELAKAVFFNRSLSDSYSVSDAIDTLDTSLGKTDTATITEDLVKAVDIPESDTISLSESDIKSFSTSKSDSLSITESFSRNVQFDRDFSDGFSLDDRSSVTDELQTDVGLVKGNIVNITENLLYTFNKPLSDSYSLSESADILYSANKTETLSISDAPAISASLIKDGLDNVLLSEQEVISFEKALSDSATISESISILLVVGGDSSVLNTAALNTSVLN